MFDHLSQNQLADYAGQKLSAAELLLVSDHLEACEPCRGRAEQALGSDASFFALRSEAFGEDLQTPLSTSVWTHPTAEQMAQHVDGFPAGEELQLVKDHLTMCEQCTPLVNDLRAFKNQIAPKLDREYKPDSGRIKSPWKHRLLGLVPSPALRSPFAWSSALAVLLLMVTGWLIWQAQQKKQTTREVVTATPAPGTTPHVEPSVLPTPPPISNTEGPAAPLVAQLNDAGATVTLDSNGKLSGMDNVPTAYQRMVKDSLSNQRIVKSSLLAGLSRPGSSLMGGDEQGKTFSVTGPVGKVMLSDRPGFLWSRLDGAEGYIVEVYDDKFNLVASSPQLSVNKWTASQPLRRGEVYSWQVKAIKDGRDFISPRPPAPQAKFRILDQGKASELAQARRAYASSHLTMGLLYAQAGLLDEAEKEFRALQKANSDSALVQRLLIQVRRLRR